MAKRQTLDPNAAKALSEMKEEVSHELGVTNNITNDKNHQLDNEKEQTVEKISENMTEKLIKMGKEDMLEKW